MAKKVIVYKAFSIGVNGELLPAVHQTIGTVYKPLETTLPLFPGSSIFACKTQKAAGFWRTYSGEDGQIWKCEAVIEKRPIVLKVGSANQNEIVEFWQNFLRLKEQHRRRSHLNEHNEYYDSENVYCKELTPLERLR